MCCNADLGIGVGSGSSSLKFKVYATPELHTVLGGSVKLSDSGARVCIRGESGVYEEEQEWDAISPGVLEHILAMMKRFEGVDIRTVVHRVVHGAHLSSGVAITKEDQHHLQTLEWLARFAPLHNGVSVSLIRACLASSLLRDCENVCCFDTHFHATIDEVRGRYLLDRGLAGSALPGGMEMRRWGFHGLSYEAVLHTLPTVLGRERGDVNAILCHLGAGSSVCAVVQGRSWDTSMGLTPLEGLPGATRSGTVDPVLVMHIPRANERQPSGVTHAEEVLNQHSGFKAVAGTSDFRTLVERRKTDSSEGKSAKLAFDMYVDRLVGFLGSYAAKMSARGGVHAVVFTGGIGEASHELHVALAHALDLSPLAPADIATKAREGCRQLGRTELGLQGAGGSVAWLVCRTDEEAEMARQMIQKRG